MPDPLSRALRRRLLRLLSRLKVCPVVALTVTVDDGEVRATLTVGPVPVPTVPAPPPQPTPLPPQPVILPHLTPELEHERAARVPLRRRVVEVATTIPAKAATLARRMGHAYSSYFREVCADLSRPGGPLVLTEEGYRLRGPADLPTQPTPPPADAPDS